MLTIVGLAHSHTVPLPFCYIVDVDFIIGIEYQTNYPSMSSSLCCAAILIPAYAKICPPHMYGAKVCEFIQMLSLFSMN